MPRLGSLLGGGHGENSSYKQKQHRGKERVRVWEARHANITSSKCFPLEGPGPVRGSPGQLQTRRVLWNTMAEALHPFCGWRVRGPERHRDLP